MRVFTLRIIGASIEQSIFPMPQDQISSTSGAASIRYSCITTLPNMIDIIDMTYSVFFSC